MCALATIYSQFFDTEAEELTHLFHSIKTKLTLLLFIPLILFAVAAFFLLGTLSSTVNRLSDRLYDQGSVITQLMLNADRDLYQALTAYLVLTTGQADTSTLNSAQANYELNVEQTLERLAAAKERIDRAGLWELVHPSSGKTLGELMAEVENSLTSWIVLSSSVMEDQSLLEMRMSAITGVFDATRGYIDEIQEILENYQSRAIEEEKDRAGGIATGMYITLAIEWAVLIAAGIWLIRRIGRTIDDVSRKTRRVAEGWLDLPESTRYGKDELGRIQQDVDNMVARMRELIGGILKSAKAVSEASDELASSARESASTSGHVAENIQEVSDLVETQARITTETGKAIEEMAIGVQRIAESAGSISQHVEDTNRRTHHGQELLLKLKAQMDQLAGEIHRLGETVAVLNDKSAEIGSITANITSFANQTGILSLNASIEAARAGEHGRGFAVVAGEIRKLAASSLESANHINNLVSDTLQEIGNANARMRTTIHQVELGSSIMQEVAEGFQAIASSIREVTAQIHEMSSVTQQMSASSEEVSASVDQAAASVREVSGKAENVAAATEEQLALVENISHAAEQLRDVVNSLNKAVGYFKIAT